MEAYFIEDGVSANISSTQIFSSTSDYRRRF